MIRIVRLQDVVDLEGGGGVNSVMVVANDSGLTAEISVSAEQIQLIVRLVQADQAPTQAQAPRPEEPEAPRLSPETPAQTVAPPREVDLFQVPEGAILPVELDTQSLLDAMQPQGGVAIPGEDGGGVGQL